MSQHKKPTPEERKVVLEAKKASQAAFLAAFALCGNVTRAAAAAEIDRRTHQRWMKEKPYAEAFADAQEEAADQLEEEARRRAVEGTVKPVFYMGEVCGTVREYSDTLLIFLMKGANPAKYSDRLRAEHSGPGGGPIQSTAAVTIYLPANGRDEGGNGNPSATRPAGDVPRKSG